MTSTPDTPLPTPLSEEMLALARKNPNAYTCPNDQVIASITQERERADFAASETLTWKLRAEPAEADNAALKAQVAVFHSVIDSHANCIHCVEDRKDDGTIDHTDGCPVADLPQSARDYIAGVERMREALETIAEGRDVGRHDGLPEDGPAHDAETMFALARAALTQEPGK